MPVSRKRKKKTGKSTKSRSAHPIGSAEFGGPPRSELRDAVTGLFENQRRTAARRDALAVTAADRLVAELVPTARTSTDSDLEDDICAQFGRRLWEVQQGPVDDEIDPDQLAQATITAAATAVRSALADVADEPDGWRAPWHVLATTARIVPPPASSLAAEVIARLRQAPGGRVLPVRPATAPVSGEALWTRDVYGSRFGVTAAFTRPDGPDRWYLWDVDACGHRSAVVHSGYYATQEHALAAWQAGVGPVAAGDATFGPVDDPSLLAGLIIQPAGPEWTGPSDLGQCCEYLRGGRLAADLFTRHRPPMTARPGDLDATTAEVEFATWLRARRPERAEPVPDETIMELADSWLLDGPPALYNTCSPHRIAFTVLHLRNYYRDDFVAELMDLLPDWAAWLAERNGTPPELAARCLPYLLGQTHDDVGADDSQPNDLARVIE